MTLFPVPKLRGRRDGGIRMRPETGTTTPVFAEYKEHFPVGVRMGADVDVYTPGSHDTTLNIHAKYNTGWRRYMQDDVIGLRENNLEYVDGSTFSLSLDTSQSEFVSGSDPILNKLDASTRRGKRIRLIFGTMNDPGIAAVLNDPTADYADASTAVANLFSTYSGLEDHRSIMTWGVGDDIGIDNKGAQAQHIAHALQDQDPWGRPCVYVCTDDDLWALDTDLRVALTYAYPCGVRPDGDVAPEGDFHRTSFQGSYGVGADLVDVLRAKINVLGPDVPLWFHLQCHGNAPFGGTGVPVNSIRKPTPAEMRKMFWVAIAEGVKGLFWFTWDLVPGLTEGLAHITENVDRRLVAAELAGRLTPEMRSILLRCTRVSDEFSAIGGGSNGYDINYPNAHITTLQNRDSGTNYVVVVNNSTSTETITIDSSTQIGHLVNMETGERVHVGGSITLRGLDGTMFRHNNLTWDRIVPIDFSATDAGKDRWSRHWANPESDWHVPYGAIALIENTVVATPTTIVQLVDDCTKPTTFLLSPGTYEHGQCPQLWKGQSDMHFAPLDPNNRPIVRSVSGWGIPDIADYHAWAGNLRAAEPTDELEVWNDQPRNIIVRDLDFRGVPEPPCERIQVGPVLGEWYPRIGGCNFKMYVDILIEGCTFDEFVAPHRNQIDDYTGTCTYDEAPQGGHPATIYNSSNANFCVVRNCHFNGWVNPQNGFGGPTPFTCDGTYGFVFVENTTSGRFLSGSVFLTNDDHSFDQDKTGNIDAHNERHTQFCVVANNDFVSSVGAMSWSARAASLYIYKNVFTNASNAAYILHIDSQNDPYQATRFKHVYRFYYNTLERNVYKAVPLKAVETVVPTGDLTNPLRGRIGNLRVIKNATQGLGSGSWIEEDNVAGDGVHIVENNWPPNYNGETWTDLGLIPNIGAGDVSTIRTMVEHNDRIYIGYGDWTADTPAACNVVNYDPETNTFANAGALDGHASHAMRTGLDTDGKPQLWMPVVDHSLGDNGIYGLVSRNHGLTEITASAVPSDHLFDAIYYKGNWYIAGAKATATTDSHAAVWKRTGTTGEVLAIAQAGTGRMYGLFELNGTLYAAPNSGTLRSTTDGTTWTTTGTTLTSVVWKPVTAVNGVYWKNVDTSTSATGDLRRWNGTSHTVIISGGVIDHCLGPDGLCYALVGTIMKRMSSAATPVVSDSVTGLPAGGTALCASVYGLFVATSDGHLWRYST